MSFIHLISLALLERNFLLSALLLPRLSVIAPSQSRITLVEATRFPKTAPTTTSQYTYRDHVWAPD